jgi:hypothetical protein
VSRDSHLPWDGRDRTEASVVSRQSWQESQPLTRGWTRSAGRWVARLSRPTLAIPTAQSRTCDPYRRGHARRWRFWSGTRRCCVGSATRQSSTRPTRRPWRCGEAERVRVEAVIPPVSGPGRAWAARPGPSARSYLGAVSVHRRPRIQPPPAQHQPVAMGVRPMHPRATDAPKPRSKPGQTRSRGPAFAGFRSGFVNRSCPERAALRSHTTLGLRPTPRHGSEIEGGLPGSAPGRPGRRTPGYTS